MDLPEWWKHEKVLISTNDFKKYSLSDSPLANSVKYLNSTNLEKYTTKDKLLEIGYGSDNFVRNESSCQWYGIDVRDDIYKSNNTRIASVDEIPFSDNFFNLAISNQSMEHWFEYDVDIKESLNEISRVLKVNGKLYINFPFFLHGNKLFLQGSIEKIIKIVKSTNFEIQNVQAIAFKNIKNYHGWLKCNFPSSYVFKYRKSNTSFVVNLILKKSNKTLITNNFSNSRKNVKRISKLKFYTHYGISVITHKFINKLKSNIDKLLK